MLIPVLIILTIIFWVLLKKSQDSIFGKIEVDYESLGLEFDKLAADNKKIKEASSILRSNLEADIALYDITKEICKSLDEDNISVNFCELIKNYVQVGECKFIKEGADLSPYGNNYTVFPLSMDKDIKGYLVAEGLKNEDEERFQILTGQFLLAIKRAILYKKVQEMAITDSLTMVFGRRHLLKRTGEELERSRKFNYRFAFLMIDIDHFKGYNDRYGHLVGDAILKDVSATIKGHIRQIDLVGRYGGEEFSVILSETDRQGGRFAAERIRQAIEERRIKVYDEDLKVTVSIGVAVFPEDAKDRQMLIDRADAALYRAKEAGRNKVCIFSAAP